MMDGEAQFIDLLRGIASHPAARGLNDDAAVLEFGSETLVVTHDAMAQDVHFFDDADPADVAWKLLAVNLSDLAAKGAKPVGVLLGYSLSNSDWDAAFTAGLHDALVHYDVPLLGGDTVRPAGESNDKRSFGLTAIGQATSESVPSRAGAQAGDRLYITGPIGAAYAGYQLAKERSTDTGDDELLNAFLRPTALLEEGALIAETASASMDVSDGILLDASRMARASGLGLRIDLQRIPFSIAAAKRHFPVAQFHDDVAFVTDVQCAKLAEDTLTFGDDYQLLFALSEKREPPVNAWYIGDFESDSGLKLTLGKQSILLPESLGFQHH